MPLFFTFLKVWILLHHKKHLNTKSQAFRFCKEILLLKKNNHHCSISAVFLSFYNTAEASAKQKLCLLAVKCLQPKRGSFILNFL